MALQHKTFTMSMYASKAELYKAKAEYYMNEAERLQMELVVSQEEAHSSFLQLVDLSKRVHEVEQRLGVD